MVFSNFCQQGHRRNNIIMHSAMNVIEKKEISSKQTKIPNIWDKMLEGVVFFLTDGLSTLLKSSAFLFKTGF